MHKALIFNAHGWLIHPSGHGLSLHEVFCMRMQLGGTQLFLGGCVPHGFQNVGSREQIFLEKWGSWEGKFGKIWVYFGQNMAENQKIF